MLNNNVIDSSENAGKTARPGKDLEQWVKAAGFEDVVVTKVPCAFGTWPKDKRLKEIGTWNHVQASEGLESFTVWLFTTILGWKKEEVDILCHKVRAEWKNPRCHSMMVRESLLRTQY